MNAIPCPNCSSSQIHDRDRKGDYNRYTCRQCSHVWRVPRSSPSAQRKQLRQWERRRPTSSP